MYKNNFSPKKVIKLTMQILESMQAREYNWYITFKKECEKKAKTFQIKHYDKNLKITVIKSNEIDIKDYIKQKLGSAVVIQQKSSGHTFIFTNKNFEIDLKPIIRAIRLRETELNNKSRENLKDLFRKGKHPEVDNWFYDLESNSLLNGDETLSNINIKATKIPLEEIFQFVVNGISSDKPVDKNPLYYNYGFSEYKSNNSVK